MNNKKLLLYMYIKVSSVSTKLICLTNSNLDDIDKNAPNSYFYNIKQA